MATNRYHRELGAGRSENGVIIRSFFGRDFGHVHPQAVLGYYSVQLLQTVEDLLSYYAGTGYSRTLTW